MKAIVLEKAGGVENLLLKDVDQPTPNVDEVLVAVKSISINPVDFKVRAVDEVLTMICGEDRPAILGWDIAGTVSAVGENVTEFKRGDRVFGMVNFPGRGNAYAEMVAAPADHLAKMPDNVSFEEAAATTLAALTALQVLRGRVQKGDRVLIHAGAGGVGHFAIQIAKQIGAYVLATASAKNRDFVLAQGADEHIDYREKPFQEVVSNIDFVLDGMGGDVLANSLKVVKDGGRIISLPTGEFPNEVIAEAQRRNLEVAFILVHSNGDDMTALNRMLGDATLKAHVSKTFALADMGKAHTEMESGRTVGKIVVTV